MDSTSEFSTPPPPSGPNLLAFDDPNVKLNELDSYMTFEERDAFKKIADEKLLEDAMAGQNLLGVMIEEAANAGGAKHKFKSSYSGQIGMQGSDAMDMFIDPLSVFGSERHPALQEVLKQIDKTKKSRGEYLKKMRELQGD